MKQVKVLKYLLQKSEQDIGELILNLPQEVNSFIVEVYDEIWRSLNTLVQVTSIIHVNSGNVIDYVGLEISSLPKSLEECDIRANLSDLLIVLKSSYNNIKIESKFFGFEGYDEPSVYSGTSFDLD